MIKPSISVSRLSTYQKCPASFDMRYNDGIRLKQRGTSAMSLGSIVHHLIAEMLTVFWKDEDFDNGYPPLLDYLEPFAEQWDKENRPQSSLTSGTLEFNGELLLVEEDDEFFERWQKNLDEAIGIVENFFWEHNFYPDGRYEVITMPDGSPAIEVDIDYELDNYVFKGFVDAVIKDKETGLIHIVDWKTRKAFTDFQKESLDRQIPVYIHMLGLMGVKVDVGTIWQIKSIAPRYPETTQSGRVSRQKIISTYRHYASAIEANGESCDDPYYKAMLQTLSESEFFRPITINRRPDKIQAIWEDFLAGCDKMYSDDSYTHAYGYPCGYCSYSDICQARLSDYDVDHLLQERYEDYAPTD